MKPMKEYIDALENALMFVMNTTHAATKIDEAATINVKATKDVSIHAVKEMAQELFKWNSLDWFPFHAGEGNHLWDGCEADARDKVLHFPMVANNLSTYEKLRLVGEVKKRCMEIQRTLANSIKIFMYKESDYMENLPEGVSMADHKIDNILCFLINLFVELSQVLMTNSMWHLKKPWQLVLCLPFKQELVYHG